MDTTGQPPTVLSVCAGYGGIELGLERVFGRIAPLAHVEIEAFAVANLVAKMEAGLMVPTPVWTDLKTLRTDIFRGAVDIYTGGFPCQPFSAAGKRGGDEDPRHLFPYIKKHLAEIRPTVAFLENVEGIISSKLKGDGWADPEGTPVLLHVLRELERVGYRATAGVFSASEVGAPHQRKRVFIYGELSDTERQGCEGVQRIGSDKGEVGERGSRPYGTASELHNDSRGQIWPSRPGEEQYDWEPPRVVGNTRSKVPQGTERGDLQRDEQRPTDADRAENRGQTQPTMGRDADGLTDRLDDALLYESCDNRVDELRLLGNGVVPATAERAWRVLSARLRHTHTPTGERHLTRSQASASTG